MRKTMKGQTSTHTLTEKAYGCIKNGIVRGEIEEGLFLSEKEIMKRYRIGRTPFREACNRLHHEHLLEVVPRRGYLVPEMSLQEVRDLFELRVLVEGAIAELAAARANPREIDELARLADQSPPSGIPRKGGNDRAETNANFHLCLASMAHNRELMRLERSVLERTKRLAYNVARSTGIRDQEMSLTSLHRPIVEAIRRRDRVAARRAVVHDIQQAQTILVGLAGVFETPHGGQPNSDAKAKLHHTRSASGFGDKQ
ncbi:MAG TPA: GntR family transcriptional regulator [Candidatus Dormibacteraeota bacterium]|nr:GntR family transcriptional regulator [Candidatus Dormibacteraeota bacterium]